MYTITLSSDLLTQLYRGMMESVSKHREIARGRKSLDRDRNDYAYWINVSNERREAIRTCLQLAIDAGFVINEHVVEELNLKCKSV